MVSFVIIISIILGTVIYELIEIIKNYDYYIKTH